MSYTKRLTDAASVQFIDILNTQDLDMLKCGHRNERAKNCYENAHVFTTKAQM